MLPASHSDGQVFGHHLDIQRHCLPGAISPPIPPIKGSESENSTVQVTQNNGQKKDILATCCGDGDGGDGCWDEEPKQKSLTFSIVAGVPHISRSVVSFAVLSSVVSSFLVWIGSPESTSERWKTLFGYPNYQPEPPIESSPRPVVGTCSIGKNRDCHPWWEIPWVKPAIFDGPMAQEGNPIVKLYLIVVHCVYHCTSLLITSHYILHYYINK
jgi:hypothetical protein